jgi:hypothetical protein
MQSAYEEYVNKEVPGLSPLQIWSQYFYSRWGNLDEFLKKLRSGGEMEFSEKNKSVDIRELRKLQLIWKTYYWKNIYKVRVTSVVFQEFCTKDKIQLNKTQYFVKHLLDSLGIHSFEDYQRLIKNL